MTEPFLPQGEPVIATAEDLRNALARAFLVNSDAGDDMANDELILEIRRWQRRQQQQ